MPPPTAYMAVLVKVAKKKLPLHFFPLVVLLYLAVHLSLSILWPLSVCLRSAGIAARPAGSTGEHMGATSWRAAQASTWAQP